MTTEQARGLVARLRRKGRWRKLPASDLALLQSQAETDENVSFMLAVMLGLVFAGREELSWWDLGFLGVVAFIVYSRWDMNRLRQAMRLLQEGGSQSVQES